MLVFSAGACATNLLQGSGGGCGSASSPFRSAVLSCGSCSGQQEIPVAVSLFSAAVKPILTLRAAKARVHSWVQSVLVGPFLRGSFLRKLQAATPSVLLLFTMKVNRSISSYCNSEQITLGTACAEQVNAKKYTSHSEVMRSLPPKVCCRVLSVRVSKAGIFTNFRVRQRYPLASYPVW